MTASGERRAVRLARDLVLDRCFRLTRGLPAAVAHDRHSQLESDLWEHAAAHRRRGGSEASLAIAVLLRMVGGLPADAAWRAEQVRRANGWTKWRTGPRPEEDIVKKRSTSPIAKPWVHLQDAKPFDQTNGVVDFDAEVPADSTADDRLSLLERGAASNIVNVGFGGGGF